MANRLLEVLELIDTARWERQTALISLLSLEELPRSLRKHELRDELGRTPGGIKYDLRVLERLRADRVVICWPGVGRRPHLWAVNHRVDCWRHVPWLHRRARSQALLIAGKLWEPFVAQSLKTAGQGVDVWEPHPPKWVVPTAPTRRDVVPTTPRVVPTTPQSTPPEQPVYETQVPTTPQSQAPITMPLTRLPSEDSSSSNDDERPTQIEGRLRRAVGQSVGPVFGRPRVLLDQLEAEHQGDDLDRLERYARSLAGKVQSPVGAVDLIADFTASLYAPPPAGPSFYRPLAAAVLTAADIDAGQAAAADALRSAREALGRQSPPVN